MGTQDHPLDIKLRADLLGKRLLFLGYSFGDENVSKLLDTIRRAFSGKLPPSYLIAFEYTELMDLLSETYGIKIIDPHRLFPDAPTSAAAFERCLKTLCDYTLNHQVKHGLETMFSGDKINPRMVTDYEIDAVASIIETGSFDVGVKAFRGAFDGAIAPTHLQERVTELFGQLANKVSATNDKEMQELVGALFDFHLPIVYATEATAFVMTACNRRAAPNGFDSLSTLVCPAIPDDAYPVAAAMAVAILLDRNEPISESFRPLAVHGSKVAMKCSLSSGQCEADDRCRLKAAVQLSRR